MFEQAFKNIDNVLHSEAGCKIKLDYAEQTSSLLFLKYLDDLEEERAIKAELAGKEYEFIIDNDHRWTVSAASKQSDISFDHDKSLTGEDFVEFVSDDLYQCLPEFRERAENLPTIEYKIGSIRFGQKTLSMVERHAHANSEHIRGAMDQPDNRLHRLAEQKNQ